MRNDLTKGSQPNRTVDDFPLANECSENDWSRLEQTANVVDKEAQHLIHMAGSPERAKQAIDTVSTPPTAAHEELAQDLGYDNVRQMMEQTEIVPLPSGSYIYLTADADNYWVAWRDKPFYDIQRFEGRQQAIASLQECADWMRIKD